MKRGRQRSGLAVENNFNAELAHCRPMHIIQGDIRLADPQASAPFFKSAGVEDKVQGAYLPLADMIKVEEGEIRLDDKKPEDGSEVGVARVARYRPPGLARRERFCIRPSANEVGVFSPPEMPVPRPLIPHPDLLLPQLLFVGGVTHDLRIMLIPGFDKKNVGTIGVDRFRFKSGEYAVGDILSDERVALLFDEKQNLAFFGEDCTVRPVSTDECRVTTGDSDSGYRVFRLRRNCVALLEFVGHDGSPTLFGHHGVYAFPDKEIGRLVIYDLNNPSYHGSDELKVLHLDPTRDGTERFAFYYSDDLLASLKRDSKDGSVHTARSQEMPIATEQGIQIIYDPEGQWHFQQDLQSDKYITHKKRVQPVKSGGGAKNALKTVSKSHIISKFSHGDFELVRVEIDRNDTLYYIESYGDCHVIKLPDSEAEPNVENISKFRIRSEMAYVRHADALYFVHFKRQICDKLNLSGDKISAFDEKINPPTRRARGLTDRELDELEQMLDVSLQKSAVFDSFKGGEHQIYYNPELVKLELADQTYGDTQNSVVVTFAQFSIIQIPFNSFAITKLQSQAALASANQYGREEDLKVYSSGTMLINRNVERFIAIWPIIKMHVDHTKNTISARTRNHVEVEIKLGIDYRIVDGLKSVIPNLVGNWQGTDFKDVLQGQLSTSITGIVKQVFVDFVGEHTFEDLQQDLKSASGGLGSPSQATSPAVLMLTDGNTAAVHGHREAMQKILEKKIEAKAQEIGLGTMGLSYDIEIANPALKKKFATHLEEMYDEDHRLRLSEAKHRTAAADLQTKMAKESMKFKVAQEFVKMSRNIDGERLADAREVVEILDGKGASSNSYRSEKSAKHRSKYLKKSHRRRSRDGTSVFVIPGGVRAEKAGRKSELVDSGSSYSSSEDESGKTSVQRSSLFRDGSGSTADGSKSDAASTGNN